MQASLEGESNTGPGDRRRMMRPIHRVNMTCQSEHAADDQGNETKRFVRSHGGPFLLKLRERYRVNIPTKHRPPNPKSIIWPGASTSVTPVVLTRSPEYRWQVASPLKFRSAIMPQLRRQKRSCIAVPAGISYAYRMCTLTIRYSPFGVLVPAK